MSCKMNCSKGSVRTRGCDKHVPKKVVTSKTLSGSYSQKISSVAFTSAKKPLPKPKKTTRSDLTFSKVIVKDTTAIDYCKNCGDGAPQKVRIEKRTSSVKFTDRNERDRESMYDRKPIQQYYKNKNFIQSSESIHAEAKKPSLDTIKEVSELRSLSDPSTIYKICSDSEEEAGYLDVNKEENIKQLRDFRTKNYFECHSAKTRIQSKGSATSLHEHKCVYRFYLNDRLFPVPLSADHRNVIRCVECHLPMDIKESIEPKKSDSINGTIQAKVKLGSEIQDLTLLLPVKEPLIVRERKRADTREHDVVYFGVIKLNPLGDSMFNRTLPSDSLALKYQKGYKEYGNVKSYRYECQDEGDVIVI